MGLPDGHVGTQPPQRSRDVRRSRGLNAVRASRIGIHGSLWPRTPDWPQCGLLISPHFRQSATGGLSEHGSEVAEGMGSRVELFEQIRRDHEFEGLVEARAGAQGRSASADGAAGAWVAGAAEAEAAGGAVGAEAGRVSRADRFVADRWFGGAAQAAAGLGSGAPRETVWATSGSRRRVAALSACINSTA